MVSAFGLCCAAAGTYENFPATWEGKDHDVHVFLSTVEDRLCLAHEGTQSFDEWLRDFEAVQVPIFDHPQFGPLHLGLWSTTGEVYGDVANYLEGLGWPPFVLTGHSKGAGEVIIMAARFKADGHPPERVAAFEPPRVGGSMLRDYLADIDILVTRTVAGDRSDIVTEVPYGPTWDHPRDPIRLRVPASDDIATQHRIPAVLQAVVYQEVA